MLDLLGISSPQTVLFTKHTSKMKKIILSAVAALLTVGAANAQLSIAPEVGLNIASLNGKGGGNSISSGMNIGARVGAVVEFGITNNIFLRPGLQFSMLGGKGGDLKIGNTEVTETINYIQVPVNVLYKLGEEGDGRFYVGLVPYFGFAIGGKYKVQDVSESLKIGSDEAKDDVKALDLGAGIKVGYELPMGLYVDAAFMQGLANIVPGGNSDNKVMTRNITIGVGYFVMRGGSKRGGKM
jgi:hypothetical protein